MEVVKDNLKRAGCSKKHGPSASMYFCS